MFSRQVGIVAACAGLIAISGWGAMGQAKLQDPAPPKEAKVEKDAVAWTDTYLVEAGDLGPTGSNPYFILEPGHFRILRKGNEEITITVLNETKMVDGVETRVIEEKETKDGKLVEISRNFFAISKRTNSVYYFGEEVDIYENGKVINHDGAWLSGVKGAKFGLMMPGTPLVGSRYMNEVAPDVALDRSEIVSVKETLTTIAGTFKNCVKIQETTVLEPESKDFKIYAPGIGLVHDSKSELVKHGKLDNSKKE